VTADLGDDMLNVVILLVSLVVLTLGAEMLVRGASGLARRMGVSSFFIGLTIVGFGTSTPELATGITAAIKSRTAEGYSNINIGNVVGSNICNIALILGLTALICPIPVRTRVVRKEVLIVIGTSLLPFLAVLNQGVLFRWEGAVMVALLVLYVWRGYRIGRKGDPRADRELEQELARELRLDRPGWMSRPWAAGLLIAAGLALLVGGSHFLVDSAVDIARRLHISELVISLTIVAFGTSAPELFTSLVAALRRQSDISVGNILGSNVFNVLGILGITCVIQPQDVDDQVVWFDTPVMILASIALLPIMLTGARISRLEGGLLLLLYLAYLGVLIGLAGGRIVPPW
jgi:cation:H+ antiporter